MSEEQLQSSHSDHILVTKKQPRFKLHHENTTMGACKKSFNYRENVIRVIFITYFIVNNFDHVYIRSQTECGERMRGG